MQYLYDLLHSINFMLDRVVVFKWCCTDSTLSRLYNFVSRSVFSNARGLIVVAIACLRCLAGSIIAAVRKVSESMKDLLRATVLWGAQLELSKCLQEIEALRHEPRAVFSAPLRATFHCFP